MTQSIRIRVLSVLTLLVIGGPVLAGFAPMAALLPAGAAEAAPAAVDEAAVPVADFTVPRPVEEPVDGGGALSPGVDLARPQALSQTTSVLPKWPGLASEQWLTTVGADIRQTEYQVTWQEQTYLAGVAASYQAPNRAHNLRTYFTPEGLRIVPRTWYTAGLALNTELTWTLGLALVGYGSAGDVSAVEVADLAAAGNRLEYRRDDITEWYVNDERGLEQGFTLTAPPAAASSEVVLELTFSSNLVPVLTDGGQAVEFWSADGRVILRYKELAARDAAGRELRAYLELSSSTLSVRIDTAGAVYPVAVDPMVTNPDWESGEGQGGSTLGLSVGTAGDVNNDGYDDIMVSVHLFDNGQTDEGQVRVFYGSPDGLSSSPDWTAESDQANAEFGMSLRDGGDVNNDGYDDVIVGAWKYDNGQAQEGGAFAWYGSSNGLGSGGTPGNADWATESNQEAALYGHAVGIAGDVNGDGYDDIVVGAPGYNQGSVKGGRAYVYYGSSSGLSSSPGWTDGSNQVGADFGWVVGTAGDVNNDGWADVIVGAWLYDGGQSDEGAAYVYYGSSSGLGNGPDWSAEGDQVEARFGSSVGTTGDVNGDGYDEVIVGAHLYDNGQTGEGRVYTYYGSSSGLNATASWTAESNQDGGGLGYAEFSVGTAGDVNDDGYADVIVGAGFYDHGQVDEGAAFIWLGSSTGLGDDGTPDNADWMGEGNQVGAEFGAAVATAGDVDGDGVDDFIVGAIGASRAYVYYGLAALPGDQCRCGSATCELGACGGLFCPGQPLNAFDGNHTYNVEDLRLPTVGRELAFARTYASQDITATVLGYGWTHNWAMRLVFSGTLEGEEGRAIIVGPDGARLRYTEHVSGTEMTYVAYPGIHGELVRQGTAPTYTYVLTGTAQTAWTFDADGILQEVRDAQGHTTTLSYTTTVTCTNVLAQVTGPDADGDPDTGRYLAFSYDDDCRVVEVRDHNDRFVAFGYDQSGDLTVVTDTRGFTWTYTYSGSHLLYEVWDPNGHLVEKTAYDAEGRAVQQWVGEQSTPVLELGFGDGLTRVVTDARGISETVTYNARNSWSGTLDAAGNPITRSYDADFNLGYTQDANGNPTAIDWNDCGCRPTQVTDALDGETIMTYDERNNLTSYTDAGDHTTYYYYADGTSLLVSTTNELGLTTYYTYSDNLPGVPDGLLLEMQAPGNQYTRYQYDAYGQMLSTAMLSDSEWITTTAYAYDTWGRTISTTTFGRMDATYYDAAGHVTRTVQHCTAGDYEDCRTVPYNAAYPGRNIVTENHYDPAGRLVLVTNTLDVVSFYEYDESNRLVRTVENYDAGKAQNEDNLYNITTRYGYDPAGHQVRVTDTLDMVTWTGYDQLGRVAAVTVNYTTTTPNPDPTTYNLVTAYGYDPAGNQVTVTNPLGMVTRNEYDPLNRLVTTTVNYTTTTPNPDPATYNLQTVYGYDPAGNQVTVTNPLQIQTVTTYDELNRVQQVTQNHVDGDYSAAAPDEDVYTRYHYDSAGRQDAVGRIGLYTTTYGFDALGRQTTVSDALTHTITSTYDVQGRLLATIDANGNTTTYGYDALGRTIAVTDALTQTAYYAFDGLGRRVAVTDAAGITTHYEYDLLGRLITVTENYSATGPSDAQTNVQTVYGYDPRGNRLFVINARGYTTTYEYDDLSRLITETDPEDHTWEYGYDALGRQVVITDPLTVTTRTHDELGRLRQVEYGATVSATYAYNALGRRTAMTNSTGVTTYLYDDLGRVLLLTHSVTTTAAYTVGYGYDGRGLRTLLVYPDGTRITSTYDLAGRLTAVDGVTTTYASYDYDDGNRLISATLGNGVRTAYAYDAGNHLLAISHTLDGALLARFSYEYNAVGQRTRAVETVVAPDLELEIFGEEVPPPATAPAGPFAIYLPGVPRESGPAVAAQPGRGGVGAPLPFDPAVGPGGGLTQGQSGEPLVREEKAFRATFDEQGVRYEPRERLVEVGSYYVDWRLTQVRSGSTRLFHPGAPQNPPSSPPGQPDRVRYDRGDYFQEEYLVTAGGVEQRFVFPQPFPVDGDLEIEGNLLGNLELAWQDTGEIAFRAPSGEVVASYGRAIVEEACGERLVAEMTLTGRRLRIVVPREWLETACFPVVVDPLIGPNFAVSTQPLGGNQERAAVAAGAAGRLLVAWHGAGSGTDTFAQMLSAEGMLLSGTVPLDARSGDQKYPDAAGNPADGSALAVWQHNAGSVLVPNWNLYARLVYTDGTFGARQDVYTGTYNQEYPAVAFNANDAAYLVVWRSYNTFSGQYGIYGQVVEADGGRSGAPITIHTANVQLAYPDVTFNGSATQYLVVWQEYSGGGMLPAWEIRGEVVAADGSAVVAAFDILTGTTDQTVPAAAYSVSDTAYLVVGQHYVNGTDLNDVRARWVAADGDLDAAFDVATGTDDQRAPDAACAGNGACLVAWERQPNPGIMYWDVYGRRVNRSGTVGSAVTVTAATNDQRYPAVAYNALTAEYVVGWQDYRSGSHWDVYVQRVDADGSLDGDEVLVSAEPAEDAQDQPAAAYGTAEETHLVVWTDDRDGTDDVYGQFVAGGGALVGEAFVIAQASGYWEQTPAVAYDPDDDEYLVVWARRQAPMVEDDWDIYGQRVAGDGTLLSSTLTLCAQEGDQTAPTVAYDANTEHFLVAWADAGGAGREQGVWARAVGGGSGDREDEFSVYTGEDDQYAPAAAANAAAGEYLVVWQEGGEGDIYGQRTLTESTTGDVFTITVASGAQQAPAVAYDPERNAYLVAWAHDNGADDDVRGRMVGAEGAPVGSEITITAAAAEEQYPAVAANGAGGYVVAWEEGSSNQDIAAAVVDGSGQVLGGGAETLAAAANTQAAPALSYDATRGRYLAVWADYRHSTEDPDVYGQLYRDYTLVVEYAYDPLERLVRADYSSGVHFAYAYRCVGLSSAPFPAS